jgi:hypothetical protein
MVALGVVLFFILASCLPLTTRDEDRVELASSFCPLFGFGFVVYTFALLRSYIIFAFSSSFLAM